MEDSIAVRAFAALAQDTRLAIFRHLVSAGPSGVPAGEIGRALDVAPTSLSFHLKELERAGLVTQVRRGRFLLYALHVGGVRQLIAYITEDCCGGRPELCGAAFTQYSEFCKQNEGCDE